LKIGVDCPECLIHRGFIEVRKATTIDEIRIKTSIAVLKTIAENLSPNAVPGVVGTLREDVIRRETQNSDLYSQDKRISNIQALNLLPRLIERIEKTEDDLERFRLTAKLSAIGNLIEFDIMGYSARLDELESQVEKVRFGIDDSEKAFKLAKSSKKVLLLTDNAGEIVFDRPLVEELKRLGLTVTVAVKSAPIMNDATMDDAIQAGMDRVADKVVTTGEACVGLMLNDASQDFQEIVSESNLVVAKGMGHYETMTERDWGQPIVHVLIAKCRPIALSLGVERGQGAILLRRPKL
jgi:uncharacterized protein with ATP-grasp and redox domains